MCLVIIRTQKLNGMRGDNRQSEFRSQLDCLAHMQLFTRKTATLHFQIKTRRKQAGIFLRQHIGPRQIAIQNGRAHFAQMRAGQCDQAIRTGKQPLLAYLGSALMLVFQIGAGKQITQTQVAGI